MTTKQNDTVAVADALLDDVSGGALTVSNQSPQGSYCAAYLGIQTLQALPARMVVTKFFACDDGNSNSAMTPLGTVSRFHAHPSVLTH